MKLWWLIRSNIPVFAWTK